RLIVSGIAVPSGRMVRENVSYGRTPDEGQAMISNSLSGSSQLSASAMWPGGILCLPDIVQFGHISGSVPEYRNSSYDPGPDQLTFSRSMSIAPVCPMRREIMTWKAPRFPGSGSVNTTGLFPDIRLTAANPTAEPTGWRFPPVMYALSATSPPWNVLNKAAGSPGFMSRINSDAARIIPEMRLTSSIPVTPDSLPDISPEIAFAFCL